MKVLLPTEIDRNGHSRAYEVLARAWREIIENPPWQFEKGWSREMIHDFPPIEDVLEALLWILHKEHEGTLVFFLSEEEWREVVGKLDYMLSYEGDSSSPTRLEGSIDLSEEVTLNFQVTYSPLFKEWRINLNEEGSIHFLMAIWSVLEKGIKPKIEFVFRFVPRQGETRNLILASGGKFKLPGYEEVVLTLASYDFAEFLQGKPARW